MSAIWFKIRAAIYTITLLTVSLWAVVIAFIATICGSRLNTNYYVARTFYYVGGSIMGWTIDVEGEEYLWEGSKKGDKAKGVARSAVMVGNHQSFVDIIYLGRIMPKAAAIMAKKSIRLIPGLGWFMLMSGAVFIDRSNNKSAIASMAQAGEDMKRSNISLWIFPEGTRHLSPEPDLLPFKKGAFYLAVQSGVPIVPVVCQNYHHLFNGKTRFRSGRIKIKVLPPIPTTGLTASDVPKLVEQTREAMLKALRELHHTPVPDSPTSRQPLLASESHEALLPKSNTNGDYGSAAASRNEDEAAVEESLATSTNPPSEIAPQTVESRRTVTDTDTDSQEAEAGSKIGTKSKGRKGKKNLSIA